MCYYITAVARVRDPDALSAAAWSHRLRWLPLANSSITPFLQRGEAYFATTQGLCDCGTPLGAARRVDSEARRKRFEAEATRLRRQGWSAAKVERWIEQQVANLARDRAAAEQKNRGAAAGVQNWVDFLTIAFQQNLVDSLGLLLHFYRTDVARERLPVQSRQSLPLSELSNELLAGLEEDVLYMFHRDAQAVAVHRS